MPVSANASAVTLAADGDQNNEPARRHGARVLATMSLLLGFASLSTDVFLPAMPAMARSLGASAGAIEWTVSSYLVGFSLGQLLWGPIGDRAGRRLPIAIGLVLFVLGSAGCALAENSWQVIAARVLQAIGASAGVVLSRAMVRDLYTGNRSAQMMSTLMMVMTLAPLLGPLLGAQILALAGWRAIFAALVCIGVLTLGALWTLPETLIQENRNREPLSWAFRDFGQILQNRRFLAYAGVSGGIYAGTFAYIAGSSFAFIDYFDVSPQAYGYFFAAGVVGMMAANMVNARLVMSFGSDKLILGGGILAALSGIAAVVLTRWHLLGLAGMAVPLFGFIAATGFIVANSISGALADHPGRAGAVSALLGAAQYGSGMIGSAIVGAMADGTPMPLTTTIAAAGVCSLVCAVFRCTSRAVRS